MDGFHPEASKSFNEKATSLAGALPESVEASDTGVDEFTPDVPIVGDVKGEDIRGVVTEIQPDADGHEIARSLYCRDGVIRLEGDLHDEFIAIARDVQRVKFMRDSVSFETTAGWLGEWLLRRKLGQDLSNLTDYLTRLRGEAVEDVEVLVPLCEPYIQSPFKIGETPLRPLSAEVLSEYFVVGESLPDAQQRARSVLYERWRKDLQARTAVVVKLQAEWNHAKDVAWDQASVVASILRLFSKGIFFPTTPSNCVPFGLARRPARRMISRRSDDYVALDEVLVDPAFLGSWKLSDRMIQQDLPYLSALASLHDSPRPSPFQRDLLKAVLLYSKAALSAEVTEKLIHIFAALESLLLKADSEGIQSALSERVAFVVGESADARADIARCVKNVYAHRSGFVHGGRIPEKREDLEEVKAFQAYIWKFFFHVVAAQTKYEAKTDFLADLERRKWQ